MVVFKCSALLKKQPKLKIIKPFFYRLFVLLKMFLYWKLHYSQKIEQTGNSVFSTKEDKSTALQRLTQNSYIECI